MRGEVLFRTGRSEKASGRVTFSTELHELKERDLMVFRRKAFQGEDHQGKNSGEYFYSRGIYSPRMVETSSEDGLGENAGR